MLDVEEHKGLFRVGTRTAVKYRRSEAFDPDWTHWCSPDALAERWPSILNYLHAVEQVVHPTFTRGEAVMHAALCRPHPGFAVIDREATIGSAQDAAQDLLDALRAALVPAPPGALGWWRQRAVKLGREADVLAVDTRGRVLVIEAKQPKDDEEITWTPVQAAGYAALFNAWAQRVGTEAIEILNGMLAQRAALGLVAAPAAALVDPPTFVPVCAYGPERPTAHGLERLQVVCGALAGVQGANTDQLQVWHVDQAGHVEAVTP